VDLPPDTYQVTAKYKGVACRAGSKTGPKSTKTAIVSGGTKTINWFC
jgi:hypothetical protein